MLSGIRTGKKKRRKAPDGDAPSSSTEAISSASAPSKRADVERITAPSAASSNTQQQPVDANDNLSAAELLRRQLASGNAPRPVVAKRSSQQSDQALPFERLQKEGRIESTATSSNQDTTTQNDIVMLPPSAGNPSRPDYQPEDFRHGSRKGKVKRTYADAAGTLTQHADMSIQDMVQEERNNQQSMDEVFARNVARIGSRYKGTEFKQSSATGADEEDAVDVSMFQQQQHTLTTHARQQKQQSQQIARHDKEQSITSRCWWWMESTSFRKHMLVALGNYVSLIMAPANVSLFPGECLYMVPIPHADSLVMCDEDVWNEIYQFQRCLREMYAKEGKGIVFTETVLPSKKGFWQTSMVCIGGLPKGAEDAQMYFKTALNELAEEWGTNDALRSTKDKGLRGTIPKEKFPYFFVEWEPNRGYAQIIESSSFPKDLGQDTLAGMLDMEPVRFRKKQSQSPEQERQMVLDFVAKWKPFDWTLRLD